MFQVDTARFIAEATSIVRPEGACSDVRPAKELRHENGELKSEEEIDALVNTTCVWGRAQHVDKIVIVESFQRMGHVVAMTGDGVNDTVALHGADVGISMGITGTDVAQREADMILLDDQFSTIAVAMTEGRKMFDLMGKFAVYHINLNMTMALVVLLTVFFWMPLPVYGLGATLGNGVTCCFASLSFIIGRTYQPDMKQPPRRKKAGFFVRSTVLTVMVPYVRKQRKSRGTIRAR